MAVLAVRTTSWIWSSSKRFFNIIPSSSLSSRLLTLQDRWQQINRIQKDLLETGFTYEALDRSVIPEKHRHLHNSYTALLKSAICEEKSKKNEVIFIFDSICARYRPSKSDLLLMIQWFRDNSEPDNAVKILQSLIHFGWPLEPRACNQVIHVVGKESGSKEAQRLLDRLVAIGFTPDSYTYASMINAAAVERDAILADYWFHQYLDKDHEKNNATVYGALMKAYLRAGLNEKCIELLSGTYPVQPNVIMYSSAIEACRRASQVDRGIELFRSMISQGISPTIRIYNQIIDAVSSVGDTQSAIQFYEELKSRGLSPDICTFTTILKGYLVDFETSLSAEPSSSKHQRSKIAKIARSLLSEATLNYGVTPDLAMYTLLVTIFTHTGHSMDALLCVVDMTVVGIKPDLKLLSAVLSCLSHTGSYPQCWQLYSTMLRVGISPNLFCYQAIISSLRNLPSRARDILFIIDELRARDIVPDVKLYCTVMQVFGRANQVDLGVKVLAEAINFHSDYSPTDWCIIITTALKFLENPHSKSRFWQNAAPFLPFSENLYSTDLKASLQFLNSTENKR